MFELYDVDPDLNDSSGRYYGLIVRQKLEKYNSSLCFYIRMIYDSKLKDIHAVWTSDVEPDSIKMLIYKSDNPIVGWVCPVRASYSKDVYEFKKVYMKDKDNYDKKIEKFIIDSMI